MEPTRSSRYNVPGLARGLAVLETFTKDTPELSAPELAVRLDLPRSTLFRLLQTLEGLGYLVRSGDGPRYKLGAPVLRMGFEFLASLDVVAVGRPLLEALTERIGMPAHLVIRDGRWAVYAVCVKPPQTIMGTVTVGTRLPAHAATFGRVLLMAHNRDALGRLFPESALQKTTALTPETVDAFYALCSADAERGFAFSEGYYEPNISTIAAPVRDYAGQIVAAAGVTVPSSYIDPDLIRQGIVRTTVETAAAISTCLGGDESVYAPALIHADAVQRQASPSQPAGAEQLDSAP